MRQPLLLPRISLSDRWAQVAPGQDRRCDFHSDERHRQRPPRIWFHVSPRPPGLGCRICLPGQCAGRDQGHVARPMWHRGRQRGRLHRRRLPPCIGPAGCLRPDHCDADGLEPDPTRTADARMAPMTTSNRPAFHLAIPVSDLEAARAFYGGVLGLAEGRSSDTWVDWNFYGHQMVTHVARRRAPPMPATVRWTATRCRYRTSGCCCPLRTFTRLPSGCARAVSSSSSSRTCALPVRRANSGRCSFVTRRATRWSSRRSRTSLRYSPSSDRLELECRRRGRCGTTPIHEYRTTLAVRASEWRRDGRPTRIRCPRTNAPNPRSPRWPAGTRGPTRPEHAGRRISSA